MLQNRTKTKTITFFILSPCVCVLSFFSVKIQVKWKHFSVLLSSLSCPTYSCYICFSRLISFFPFAMSYIFRCNCFKWIKLLLQQITLNYRQQLTFNVFLKCFMELFLFILKAPHRRLTIKQILITSIEIVIVILIWNSCCHTCKCSSVLFADLFILHQNGKYHKIEDR